MTLNQRQGDGYDLMNQDRRGLGPANGTYNFVRIQGDRPGAAETLVSPNMSHAQLSQDRPVLYAGTAQFDQGEMRWWSNYSGTYQPIAAFRDRAALPGEKFVPWQRLQMGGHAQTRNVFREQRSARAPEAPAADNAAVASADETASAGSVKTVGVAADAGREQGARPSASVQASMKQGGLKMSGSGGRSSVAPGHAPPAVRWGAAAAVQPKTSAHRKPPGPPAPASQRGPAFNPPPVAQTKAASTSWKLTLGQYKHQGRAAVGLHPDVASHSFVELQGPGGQRKSWGFVPESQNGSHHRVDALRAGVSGRVQPEAGKAGRAGANLETIDLTPAQARAAQAEVDRYARGLHKFRLGVDDCHGFARAVARAAKPQTKT
ncbi:MAG: hypothetical protein AAF409_12080 [Pseudomonadota bacterium]